jgi:hypothetical protein
MKDLKQCTGCGRFSNEPVGEQYIACCPDNNYVPLYYCTEPQFKFLNRLRLDANYITGLKAIVIRDIDLWIYAEDFPEIENIKGLMD